MSTTKYFQTNLATGTQRKSLKTGLLCLSILAAACTSAASEKFDLQKAAATVATDSKWEDLRGMLAVVGEDGKPQYQKIREPGIDEGTPFEIGSLTKQFTAATIVAMEREGLLKREDLACKYVEQFCVSPLNKITIEQLLRHKSGLRHDATPRTTRLWQGLKAIFIGTPVPPMKSPLEVLDSYPLLPLEFDPGMERSYSNLGFVALSAVIEKASSLSLHDAMEHWVFKPSQMNDTELLDFSHKPGKEQPRSFRLKKKYLFFGSKSWEPMDLVFDIRETFGAGAVQASARDLLHWVSILRSGKWPELLVLDSNGYGLGWVSVDLFGKVAWYWHNGAYEGVFALLQWSPTSKKTFLILCNTTCDASGEKLFDALF